MGYCFFLNAGTFYTHTHTHSHTHTESHTHTCTHTHTHRVTHTHTHACTHTRMHTHTHSHSHTHTREKRRNQDTSRQSQTEEAENAGQQQGDKGWTERQVNVFTWGLALIGHLRQLLLIDVGRHGAEVGSHFAHHLGLWV